jgi:lactate dehydrogenase-like 2-hydroxyacid dehydrogenase
MVWFLDGIADRIESVAQFTLGLTGSGRIGRREAEAKRG